MNDQFDELTKGLAQSITRRGALKKFGLGLAGMALAALGLANNATARSGDPYSNCIEHCVKRCLKRGGGQACYGDCQAYCDCKTNPYGC